MKWMIFILSTLTLCLFYRDVDAKTPRTVVLSDSEVGTIRTAVGYTTMVQFDSRPTSAVLGDQDAFKVEYVGNGLAIKPILPHARTNLFIFTDYDRFNFQLVAGGSDSADYVLKIKRQGSQGYPVEPVKETQVESSSSKLIRKTINRSARCGDLSLAVEMIAWPESQTTYLVQFKTELKKKSLPKEIRFEPGDFEVFQNGKSLPIESLHLDRLAFENGGRLVHGTLVLRQAQIKPGIPLLLSFSPDFHRNKNPNCPRVSFSRSTATKPTT